MRRADLRELAAWIGEQPAWSDFPFVLLTRHGVGPEQNPDALRWMEVFRNISMVERPCHAVTLVSVVRIGARQPTAAIRGAGADRGTARHRRCPARERGTSAVHLDRRASSAPGRSTPATGCSRSPTSTRPISAALPESLQLRRDARQHSGEDWRRVRAAFEHTRRTGEPYDVEYTVIWPDGSEHWLASRGRMMRDGERRAVPAGRRVERRYRAPPQG